MSSSWQYFAPYDVLMCRSQTTSPIAAENLLNIPRKTLYPVVLLRITEKISYRSYDAFGADCIVTKNHYFLGEIKNSIRVHFTRFRVPLLHYPNVSYSWWTPEPRDMDTDGMCN